MERRQLACLVQGIDPGSFSRAGRVLGVRQPAISRHVRSPVVEVAREVWGRRLTAGRGGRHFARPAGLARMR